MTDQSGPSDDRDSGGLALVSGGSGAIGTAICRRLHADGWRLAIGYVSRDRASALAAELSCAGPAAQVFPLDLSDLARARVSVAELLARHGPVEAVIFCGGGATGVAPFVETDPEDWKGELTVNFTGPALVTELCLPGMLDHGRGVIVGITSEAAKVGDAGHAPYSIAKGALAAYLTELARKYSSAGVSAFSVAPGPIDTPLLERALGSEGIATKLQALAKVIPVGRLGTAEEVSECVGFMIRHASLVTGCHLSIGGGLTMQ